jgi:hypothetical protein
MSFLPRFPAEVEAQPEVGFLLPLYGMNAGPVRDKQIAETIGNGVVEKGGIGPHLVQTIKQLYGAMQ